MIADFRRAAAFAAITLLLFGGTYHGLFVALGRVAFTRQAEGSLIRRSDGTVVGSRLIAQAFVQPKYLHPRPSAVDYDASSTGASNWGPSTADHLRAVRARRDDIATREHVAAADIPVELVTTSGSGVDPHLSPAAAWLQAPRVARARNVPLEQVIDVIGHHIEAPAFGFVGRSRVNVLEVNVSLDRFFGTLE